MDSPFTLCPTCESLLRGDEKECPNCGITLAYEIEGTIATLATEGASEPSMTPRARFQYAVRRAEWESELEALLNDATGDGWEPVNVYFGWRSDDERSVHFAVLRRSV